MVFFILVEYASKKIREVFGLVFFAVLLCFFQFVSYPFNEAFSKNAFIIFLAWISSAARARC